MHDALIDIHLLTPLTKREGCDAWVTVFSNRYRQTCLQHVVRLANLRETEEMLVLPELTPRLLPIRRACLILILASLAASCTPRLLPPAAVVQTQLPAGFPEAYYRQAEASGGKVLRVDPQHSLVTIVVRRGGALARLGHDHVVASHDVGGYVYVAGGRADLYVPLERLAVDEPGLRAAAGLTTQPPAEAVDGTRRNMLEKVLESERFPYAYIHISRTAPDSTTLSGSTSLPGHTSLIVTLALHGLEKTFEIPAQIENLRSGISISGQMIFNQTDFGIVPFSVLGGALHVQDSLALHFRIFAGDN